jgi:hypothetical protein
MIPLKCKWFNGGTGTIGVIMAEDEHNGEIKFYMGAAQGLNEQIDINLIANSGAPIPELVGWMFFQKEVV